MKKNFQELNAEEQLKAENDFLKMKLMLENGAEFNESANPEEIPPDIENQFLKNIIEFESQFARQRRITVFERIGKPVHFKPVKSLDENEIEDAWQELSSCLEENGILLEAYNPKITARDLYRFAVEELFDYEMDDIRIPGLMHGFIYDEFCRDFVYDNKQRALYECLHQVFCLQTLQASNLPHFKKSNIRLNEHYPLSIEDFLLKINRFKTAYDELEVLELNETGCTTTETAMVFNGNYLVHAMSGKDQFPLSGTWQIDFELEPDGEWVIHRVQADDIHF